MMRPATDRDASIGERTATLRLRVEQPFTTAQTAEMGYVARVRDVTPGRPKAERDSVSGVVVPVGGGNFHELAVRPGSYLIEAVTPSGAVLEADVEVSEGDDQAVILSDDTPSPHEWLGWQKVSGNLSNYGGGDYIVATRHPWRLWAVIGGGVLLFLLAVFAVGYFTLQPRAEAVSTSVEAQVNASEMAPTDPEPPPVGAAPPPRQTIKRLPPGRSPASLPDDRAFNERIIRDPSAPASAPPPEAAGQGAPAPEAGLPESAPAETEAPEPLPPVADPPPDAPQQDNSGGLPGWLWLAGLGLLATGGGAAELARRGKIPVLLGRATQAAEPPPATAIFKSALPDAVPPSPTGTATTAAEAAPVPPPRLTLLTLPTGPAEWTMMLAALGNRAALSEAYAASQGSGRHPQQEAYDGAWSTYAALPLLDLSGGRPLWAIDSPSTGRAEAVRLPEIWDTDGGTVPIEILTAAEGREERVSTAVRDPRYGTLLGYLALGRLPEARALLGDGAEALFDKLTNPYLAAAGGYVLIGSATTYDDAPWRGWLQTLDVQQPWMPDAAILEAVSMVQTRQEGIRAKALEAMDRGVPIYTEGLKRLRDVLTLLIEQPDPDGLVAQSLDAVSKLAGRCNPQQVFTSLRLGA